MSKELEDRLRRRAWMDYMSMSLRQDASAAADTLQRYREALTKARDWLDYENSPMGANERMAYDRLMTQIDKALSND